MWISSFASIIIVSHTRTGLFFSNQKANRSMLDFRCFSSTFSGGYKRICYPSLKNISQKVFFCRYLSSTPSLNPLITGKDVLTSELFNNKKMVSRCLMSTQGDLRVPGDLFCVSSKAKLNNIKFFSSHGSEPPHKSKQLTKSIKNPYEGLTLGEKGYFFYLFFFPNWKKKWFWIICNMFFNCFVLFVYKVHYVLLSCPSSIERTN